MINDQDTSLSVVIRSFKVLKKNLYYVKTTLKLYFFDMDKRIFKN